MKHAHKMALQIRPNVLVCPVSRPAAAKHAYSLHFSLFCPSIYKLKP